MLVAHLVYGCELRTALEAEYPSPLIVVGRVYMNLFLVSLGV